MAEFYKFKLSLWRDHTLRLRYLCYICYTQDQLLLDLPLRSNLHWLNFFNEYFTSNAAHIDTDGFLRHLNCTQ